MKPVKLLSYECLAVEAVFLGLYRQEQTNRNCRHLRCGYREADPCVGRDWDLIPGVTHKGCSDDWCIKELGKRPNNVGLPVKCKPTKYRKYSDSELADPAEQPKLACVRIALCRLSGFDVRDSTHILYDLNEDKLVDEWWQCANQTLVVPHCLDGQLPRPSKIANLSEIIVSLKKAL